MTMTIGEFDLDDFAKGVVEEHRYSGIERNRVLVSIIYSRSISCFAGGIGSLTLNDVT